MSTWWIYSQLLLEPPGSWLDCNTVIAAVIQMTHDGECHMLIYMSRSWNVNTRAQPEWWHFNYGTYILACHTSPSCIICFVASVTKIPLNSIKNLHFTGTEPYDNYVTTSAGSKYAKIGECEATPTVAPQPMSACDLESRICLHWHNPMSHCDTGLCQCKQSQPVETSDYSQCHMTEFAPIAMHHFS